MTKRGKAARAQVPLRIPEAERARLEESAAERGVSMNQEIVDRLRWSFATEEIAAKADASWSSLIEDEGYLDEMVWRAVFRRHQKHSWRPRHEPRAGPDEDHVVKSTLARCFFLYGDDAETRVQEILRVLREIDQTIEQTYRQTDQMIKERTAPPKEDDE